MQHAGEIRLFAGNVAPDGWAFCHGQAASVTAAPALFAAIGTRFGGDGRTTFALPDLRGRVPVHRSATVALGAEGGAEIVELEADEIPDHQHSIPIGSRPARDGQRARQALVGKVLRGSNGTGIRTVSLGRSTRTGSGFAHANLQPFLCINYIIALDDAPANRAGGPVVGEIRMFGGEIAPAGWTWCNGQALDIQQFGGLYSVIGTTYGGDGRQSFDLPDLRGRVAMQAGYRPGLSARQLGESGGAATVALDESQLPPHTHELEAAAAGEASDAGATVVVRNAGRVGNDSGNQRLTPIDTGTAGADNAHSNLQPYLAVNYLIAYSGQLPN